MTSPCKKCGREKGISPIPEGPPKLRAGAWDKAWHELRSATHTRLRRLLVRIDEAPWDAAANDTIFAPRPAGSFARKGVKYLEAEHDASTLNGALYLALVPIVDITYQDDRRPPPTLHRYQACNDRGEWKQVRELIERHSPEEMRTRLADGRIKIHGGNGAWSAQQRQPDFFKAKPNALREIIQLVLHGEDNVAPTALELQDVAERIRLVQQRATELRVPGVSLARCSKLLHIAAPKDWPVYNTRANPAVAEAAGFQLPSIRPNNPDDYAIWTSFCRQVAAGRGDPDLGMTDIAFSNTYDSQNDDED